MNLSKLTTGDVRLILLGLGKVRAGMNDTDHNPDVVDRLAEHIAGQSRITAALSNYTSAAGLWNIDDKVGPPFEPGDAFYEAHTGIHFDCKQCGEAINVVLIDGNRVWALTKSLDDDEPATNCDPLVGHPGHIPDTSHLVRCA